MRKRSGRRRRRRSPHQVLGGDRAAARVYDVRGGLAAAADIDERDGEGVSERREDVELAAAAAGTGAHLAARHGARVQGRVQVRGGRR